MFVMIYRVWPGLTESLGGLFRNIQFLLVGWSYWFDLGLLLNFLGRSYPIFDWNSNHRYARSFSSKPVRPTR